MNNKNSIIGCGYIPRNVQAVCLKTKNNATLGEVEYKIISEIYERKFEPEGVYAAIIMQKSAARATVNVLDTKTGLTYAVGYEPANLVRPSVEPKTNKPGEKVELIDRAKQIIEELNEIFSAGGGISDKCGVAFFAISDNGDGKTSAGAAFVAGRGDRVISSISAACSQDPQALELVKRGVTEAMLRQVFGGGNKDDNE